MDVFVKNKQFLQKIGIFTTFNGSLAEQVIKWLHISTIMLLLNSVPVLAFGYILTLTSDRTNEILENLFKINAFCLVNSMYIFIILKETELWNILENLQWLVNSRKLILKWHKILYIV